MVTPASPLPRPLLAHEPRRTAADLKLAMTLGHVKYITTSAHFVQARPRARLARDVQLHCCARARTSSCLNHSGILSRQHISVHFMQVCTFVQRMLTAMQR